MKRILCPTDFSETAHNAIAYAAKFAQKADAELVLFNVQSLFDLSPVELFTGNSKTAATAQSMLESQAIEITQQFGISCYSNVQISNMPLTSLISEKGSQFSLIIMGSGGPDDVYQFFAGSKTYKVIRQTNIPVLLVPDEAEFSAIERVVYAFDYVHEGTPPLEQLVPWLTASASELCVLQVLDADENVADADLEERKQKIRGSIPHDLPVTFDIIHENDHSHAINKYMVRTEADVLALNTHHYSFTEKLFHKSLTKKITAMADYPVFVFHT